MYLINQLCTSVIHLFKSNVMNECHLKDSVQFEKKKKKRAFNYCGVRAIWKGFPASPCLERTWRLAFSLFCRLHMSPVTLIWIITEWSLFAVTFPSIALVASVRCERSSHLRPHCSEHVCGRSEAFPSGQMLNVNTLSSQQGIFYKLHSTWENPDFTSLIKKKQNKT